MHADDSRVTPPADRTKVLLFVLVAVLAVAVAVLATVLAVRGTDDPSAEAPRPGTTPSAGASTDAPTPEPSSSSATLSSDEAGSVVWPGPTGDVYDDPVQAATTFATGMTGFTDPVVGAFQAGDARSGEVAIRPKADGPVTTVLLRRLGDDHWYVTGAWSDDLRLESPAAGATVDEPVDVAGRSRAFEGTILVSVHAQGDPAVLGQRPLIGGANADLGPFSGAITFDSPGGIGAVVVLTHSAEDGRVLQATVVPVRFAG